MRFLLLFTGLLVAITANVALAPATAQTGTAREECSGPASQVRLYVIVENVRSSEGLMAATLYPDIPDRFLVSHGSLYVARVPAHAPTTRMCLYVPGPGTYAVAVYHDANASHHLDRRLGMPTEGYGFSNNPSTVFGVPSFEAARLKVPRTNTETRITLRYPDR